MYTHRDSYLGRSSNEGSLKGKKINDIQMEIYITVGCCTRTTAKDHNYQLFEVLC